MERTTVPFHMSDIGLDMSAQIETDGVVRIDDDALIIEFRETRTSLSTLKKEAGGVRVVTIPLGEVESMEVRQRWLFAPRLRIRTRTLLALANMPGASGNEVVLPLQRPDRDRARELAATVSLVLSTREIKRLEGLPTDSD